VTGDGVKLSCNLKTETVVNQECQSGIINMAKITKSSIENSYIYIHTKVRYYNKLITMSNLCTTLFF